MKLEMRIERFALVSEELRAPVAFLGVSPSAIREGQARGIDDPVPDQRRPISRLVLSLHLLWPI